MPDGRPALTGAERKRRYDRRERDYSMPASICYLSPSYVADTLRQNFSALGIVEESNTTILRR